MNICWCSQYPVNSASRRINQTSAQLWQIRRYPQRGTFWDVSVFMCECPSLHGKGQRVLEKHIVQSDFPTVRSVSSSCPTDTFNFATRLFHLHNIPVSTKIIRRQISYQNRHGMKSKAQFRPPIVSVRRRRSVSIGVCMCDQRFVLIISVVSREFDASEVVPMMAF